MEYSQGYVAKIKNGTFSLILATIFSSSCFNLETGLNLHLEKHKIIGCAVDTEAIRMELTAGSKLLENIEYIEAIVIFQSAINKIGESYLESDSNDDTTTKYFIAMGEIKYSKFGAAANLLKSVLESRLNSLVRICKRAN